MQLTNQVQAQLTGIFQAQEAAFLAGINGEVDFTGDWKPDEDEVLVIRALPEVQILLAAANQNAVALLPLDAANFQNEGVRALFTVTGANANRRILLQNFSAQQLFAGRLSFLFDGNVFREITEPAFALGTHLVGIVDAAGDVRFKSYPLLRRILDLTPVFRDATDAELAAFCGHASLDVADANAFVADADEGIRKQVHAIAKANVFGNHPVADIEQQANSIGFPITVNAGRIEVPQGRREAKELLSFLLNRVYLGPIDQHLFITNSQRRL